MASRILFATDGSDYAETGLRQVSRLALRLEGPLDVVHVRDTRQVFFPFVPMASGGLLGDVQVPSTQVETLQETLEGRSAEIVERARALLQESEVSGKAFAVEGPPARTLLDLAADYDFLALGKKGIGHGWSDDDIGSTTEKIVRRSHTPLLVTAGRPRSIEKVLWAYDASPSSRRLMEIVPPLCKSLGIPLTVLSVAETESDEARQREVLERPADAARQHGLEPRLVVAQGYPEEEIIHLARKEDFTLIALGASGHHRLVEFFLGSVARVVLRHSEVPVLLLREVE
jgi:nucleotide-binding universal stress UspA family protein